MDKSDSNPFVKGANALSSRGKEYLSILAALEQHVLFVAHDEEGRRQRERIRNCLCADLKLVNLHCLDTACIIDSQIVTGDIGDIERLKDCPILEIVTEP